MRIVLAVIGGVIAALLDASVAPFVMPFGQRPDFLLVTTLAVTVTIGSEAGFVWAFAGGLALDMLLAPGRPMGSTIIALLLAAGIAAVAARVAGRNHVATTVILTFPLALLYRLALGVLISAVAGAGGPTSLLGGGLLLAVVDTILVVPIALLGRWAWARWAEHDRIEW